MADISVKLKIHETGNGTIDHVYTSVATNNVSELPFATDIIDWITHLSNSNKDCIGNKINPFGLFKIGDSSTGFIGAKNYTLTTTTTSGTYKGLMFGYTNASSQFDLTLTIQGSDMGNLKIIFDKYENNYPTSYTLVERIGETETTQTYSNNSAELQLQGLSGYANQITLTFSAWSKAKAIVGITFVENQVIDVPLDKSYITSFETQNQITSDPQNADFGVLANTGSIKLKDKRNLLYNYAQMGYLKMNSFGVEIYVKGKLVQKHIVVDNPYYSADGSMEISLTNIIEKMNNVIPQKTYSAYSKLLDIFYDIMVTQCDYSELEFYNMLNEKAFSSSDVTYRDLFDRTRIQQSMTLQKGTLREQIQKICQATRSYFFQNDDGQLTFVYAGVGCMSNKYYLDSYYKDQISRLSYDILTANQYDEVVIDEEYENVNGKNILHYGTNEFLNASLVYTYNGYSFDFKTKIKQNILYEYQLGIKSGAIDCIPMSSTKYTVGAQEIQKKNWELGEMINTNDFFDYIQGSPLDSKVSLNQNQASQPLKWRVVGRKVKYDGQITLSLTLRECMYNQNGDIQ